MERVTGEAVLVSQLFGRSRFVPLPLTAFETPTHLYSVYPTRVATSLRALLDGETRGHFTPMVARYYVASVALASPSHSAITCRSRASGCCYRS